MMIRNISVLTSLIGLSVLPLGCDQVGRSSAPRVTVEPTVKNTPVESQSPISQTAGSQGISSTPVITQVAQRKTIADYFLQIPDRYLRMSRMTAPDGKLNRQQLLDRAKQGYQGSIYDPQNGYLQVVQGGDSCSRLTVAIFSRPSASPLVALNYACAAADITNILDPDQNWRDITSTVMPVDLTVYPANMDGREVELPRVGRTIEVRTEQNNQTVTKRYRFNGERFVAEY